MVCVPTQERGNEIKSVLVSSFLVPTLLRGNAYLRDEHFITSSFEEVTKKMVIACFYKQLPFLINKNYLCMS